LCAQKENNCTIRWKSREVFITELLRREWVGLFLTPTGALHVNFGHMHLGILDGESATFSAKPGCLARAQKDQTSTQFPDSPSLVHNRRTQADMNELPSAFGSGHGFFAACYCLQGDSLFTHADSGYRKLLASR